MSRHAWKWAIILAAAIYLAAALIWVAATRAATLPAPVTVAVVDSGVTPLPELRGSLAAGVDLVDGGPTGRVDMNGHGTAMASIVHRGCPVCRLLPVRVVGTVSGTPAMLAAGITWAVAHGARVVNVSLSLPADDAAVDAAVRQAAAAGVVVVIAAGNSGAADGWPGEGAAGAVVVGAVDPSGARYSWSDFGPWVTSRAPGMVSALTIRGRVFSAVGTSASAAFVSGLAGWMLSMPGVSAAQVEATLG